MRLSLEWFIQVHHPHRLSLPKFLLLFNVSKHNNPPNTSIAHAEFSSFFWEMSTATQVAASISVWDAIINLVDNFPQEFMKLWAAHVFSSNLALWHLGLWVTWHIALLALAVQLGRGRGS